MGKKTTDFDKEVSEWMKDEKFADFFRQYVNEESCAEKPGSGSRAVITYKSLYKLYTVSMESQQKIETLNQDFSQLLLQVNAGLKELERVAKKQQKINRDAKFHTGALCVVTILLYALVTCFLYQLFLKRWVP